MWNKLLMFYQRLRERWWASKLQQHTEICERDIEKIDTLVLEGLLPLREEDIIKMEETIRLTPSHDNLQPLLTRRQVATIMVHADRWGFYQSIFAMHVFNNDRESLHYRQAASRMLTAKRECEAYLESFRDKDAIPCLTSTQLVVILGYIRAWVHWRLQSFDPDDKEQSSYRVYEARQQLRDHLESLSDRRRK